MTDQELADATKDGSTVALTYPEEGETFDDEEANVLVAIILPDIPIDLFVAFGDLKADGWAFFFTAGQPGEAARIVARRVPSTEADEDEDDWTIAAPSDTSSTVKP